MGAWDYGIFDDDTAYDYMAEIEQSDNPKEVFRKAFTHAIHASYLEYEDCHAVTVSASYMDSILNGTRPRVDAADENFYPFIESNKDLPLSDLQSDAVKALEKVIGGHSELNELWADNEALYPKWKENIEALIRRLQQVPLLGSAS